MALEEVNRKAEQSIHPDLQLFSNQLKKENA
jgi:hypothetical protein